MPVEPTSRGETSRPIFSRDEVDLRQIAHALWRYRWTIVGSGLLGALLGLGVAWLSTHYVSQGLFLTPGMSMSNFKRYEASLANGPRLNEFIELTGREEHFATPLMRKLLEIPGAMQAAIRPVFGFTSRDAKAFDVQVEAGEGAMVGVQLTLVDDLRHKSSPLFALAEYFRSTVIRVDLQQSVVEACLANERSDGELRNEQLKSEFQIAQHRRRAANLEKIVAGHPEAGRQAERQVVLLEEGGERFLSPSAQLVAVEVAIADMEVEAATRARARAAAGLKTAYYCQAQKLLDTALTGTQYLERLGKLQDEVFAGQSIADGVVEQTATELRIERRHWSNAYLEQMRFVTSPEGQALRRRSPSLRVGLVGGGVLGGLLGLLLAIMLAWWHDNRESVLAKE